MSRAKRITVLLFCIGFSLLCSYAIRLQARNELLMCDFGEIYFGSRFVMQHQDPYNAKSILKFELRQLAAEGQKFPTGSARAETAKIILAIDRNLPTTLFIVIPLAVLPWTIAQNLWIALIASLLAFGAYLMWDLGADAAPDVWLLLSGFALANCQGLLVDGNAAGVTVGLCLIAAWCVLKERYALFGVVLLALTLLIKPHDVGLIWLYFLLAGGTLRKRSLQTLAVVAVFGLCTALWIAPASPHWIQELHENLATTAIPGALNNPGLSGTNNSGAGQIIDLQSVLSIFWDSPSFYRVTTYFIVGALFLVWTIAAVRKAYSLNGALLSLAAISALSLLPVYHRSNDAKLLLLTIPACAMLWTGKGPRRWIALALTSASIVLTSDIPLAVLGELTRNLAISTSTLTGKLAAILLLRPAPLVLLATGCFYLWIYLCYSPPAETPAKENAAPNTLTADAAT